MVDFNIDTSSYPKSQPIDPLRTIGQIQGIQGQAIANQRNQLALMNERYKGVASYFGTLLGQDEISDKDIANRAQELVKSGIMTPQQYAEHVSSVPSEASIRRQNPNANPQQISQLIDKARRNWLTQQALKAEDNHNAMNWYLGSDPRLQNVGGGFQPVQNRLGKVQGTGPVFPEGLPRTTEQFIPPKKDAQGNEIGTGRFAPIGEGQPNSPGLPFGGQRSLPVESSPLPDLTPLKPNRVKTVTPPPLPIRPDYNSVNPQRNAEGRSNNLTGPETPLIGGAPMGTKESVEGGLKQYQEASANSSKLLNRVKPAQQALKLLDPEVIKGLTGTGPIAAKTSAIMNALQGVGIITKGKEAVAQRQELVKNLAAYLSQSPNAQRSDEAQALASKANANPDVQLLPALIDVTRRNIARDRIMAAAPLAFKNFDEKTGKATQRTDYHNFTSHNSEFPNSIDERAFMLDSMPEEERKSFIRNIIDNTKGEEKAKFVRSMKLAQRLNMYEP